MIRGKDREFHSHATLVKVALPHALARGLNVRFGCQSGVRRGDKRCLREKGPVSRMPDIANRDFFRAGITVRKYHRVWGKTYVTVPLERVHSKVGRIQTASAGGRSGLSPGEKELLNYVLFPPDPLLYPQISAL